MLKKNQLFVKLSKCSFAQPQLEYFGNIISAEGVAADRSKVEAMLDWPQPKKCKGIEGIFKSNRLLLKVCERVWHHC